MGATRVQYWEVDLYRADPCQAVNGRIISWWEGREGFATPAADALEG